MLKQYFFLFVLLSSTLVVTGQNNRYTIEGEIPEDFNGKSIMLFTFNNRQISHIDTTFIMGGKLFFHGDESITEEAIITTGNYPNTVKSTKIILEKGILNVNLRATPTIKGRRFNIKAYRDSFLILKTKIHEIWKLHEIASDADLVTSYEQLNEYNYILKGEISIILQER